jgi:carbonic anhydrase/acetyltransferase-like protein (isoleucine patch superfamily)
MPPKDIVIDENYKGLVKKDFWYELDEDLITNGNTLIEINLLVKGDQLIKGNLVVKGSQVIRGHQVIRGNQKVKNNQIVGGNQTIRGSQKINGNQQIKGNQVIKGSQKIKGYQIVEGEQKVKGKMEILGLKTKFSLSFVQDSYRLYFMSNLIKIGCQEHSPEEWINFTDTQIKKMDEGALEWWRKWKKFVLSTHSNLVEVYNS